jgi:hypothetical protein
MAIKRKELAAVLLVLGGGLGLVAAQTADVPKPLVRRDLLVLGSGEPSPLVRDLFRPKAVPASPAVRRPSGSAKAEPEAPPAEAPPTFTLTISYLGSIRSGGRTIGLILRGGQTLDVAEGDTVAPGYKVVSVTSEVIVIEGPKGERRTFAKQGDRP